MSVPDRSPEAVEARLRKLGIISEIVTPDIDATHNPYLLSGESSPSKSERPRRHTDNHVRPSGAQSDSH
jgi:hypothetical protein